MWLKIINDNYRTIYSYVLRFKINIRKKVKVCEKKFGRFCTTAIGIPLP